MHWFLGLAGSVALMLDICLLDKTGSIKSGLKRTEHYIQKFEAWVKSLPLSKLMSWHLRFVSDKIESNIWRKHPNLICFVVGYLFTACLNIWAIHTYSNDPGIYKPNAAIMFGPHRYMVYPLVANVLGGFFLMISRNLVLWSRKKNVMFVYMAVVLLKVLVGSILIGSLVAGVLIPCIHLISPTHPTVPNVELIRYYATAGFITMILYWALALDNALRMMDVTIYLLQVSLVICVTVYLAIFVTKALRLAIRKADSMYFTGFVGAIAGLYELASRIQFHPEHWTLVQRQVLLLFLGFGH